ncbi:hypothetical protein A2875_03165 [Candidatus Gottesmanbacteria bacterium RIFCSPHIGHO2_01_FULL_46_14]|uniref:Cell envelope-related transcriptional attenuator domain-containing protein n=1 Tax=Candidatus Gottesmanbacteria bacterium RIFCSPHIGHO2_01_FULL_46_14 TaxID=1798380 RepID=A0A1F5ZR02_9BACT|nr:MAG: hypothetical protein A2875_03165 [Candidatus Gottesmanbacteria bacterium RIFCSPHIGHO2_01_FULL_46_14]
MYGSIIKRVISVVVAFLLLVVVTKVVVWSKQFMDATGLTPTTLFRLAFDTGVPLNSSNGRTNILILGIGGGVHAGADLTDTMMVFSVDANQKSIAMISLPRDIWSDTLKDKVNSAYHYGKAPLAKVITSEVVDLPIHYVLLIDFSGFEDVIDLVGGVTVAVPNAFTDPNFPIAGREEDFCNGDPEYRCRYETVSFEQGLQNMSGERALTYVRSRHAEGEEGSDFARSRRQQDVMVALKEKIMRPEVYLSPTKVRELLRAFDNATETDLRIGELATIAKIVSSIPGDHIRRISLEDKLDIAPLWLYGRYALVPKESWEAIRQYIRSQL